MRAMGIAMAVGLAVAATPVAAKRSPPAGFAEPADIIAAESNFTALSAAKGMTAAIRATAAPNAQIFAPEPLRVTQYIAHADPKLAVQWHTRQLWMSCDGSVALTHGEWLHGPASGWYVTVWQRQKGGGYKWVLAEHGSPRIPAPESDMISAGVADCPVRHARAAANTIAPSSPAHGKAPMPDYLSGQSDDATLQWDTSPAADGGRSFVLRLKRDGLMHEVLHAIAAPGA